MRRTGHERHKHGLFYTQLFEKLFSRVPNIHDLRPMVQSQPKDFRFALLFKRTVSPLYQLIYAWAEEIGASTRCEKAIAMPPHTTAIHILPCPTILGNESSETTNCGY